MSDREERKLTREGLEAGKELRGLVLFGFDQSGFERSTDGEPDAITLCCDVDELLASDWLAKRDREKRADGVRAAAEEWPAGNGYRVSHDLVRDWLNGVAERMEAGE